MLLSRKPFLFGTNALCAIGCAVFMAVTAQAAAEAYRSTALSLRLLGIERQASANIEFNLAGNATVAVEGIFIPRGEELHPEEIKERPGDSLQIYGREFALIFSRYTNPYMMSGFYWSLGAGYRTMAARWIRTPEETESETSYRLNAEGKADQEFALAGITGHGRLGYRFVGESVPVVLGIYFGLRHYQASVEDVGEPEAETEPLKSSDEVRISLQHRAMTRPEASIDFGLSL